MSNYVALLDACSMFPASVRDTLFRSHARNLYRAQWSDEIWQEVLSNLQKRKMTPEQVKHLDDEVRKHLEACFVDGYQDLTDSMTCDPKDRHVLAAAVTCGAQAIVTFNLKDFPAKSVKKYNVEIQHPDTFLVNLADLEPQTMNAIIVDQATNLKDMTIGKLLKTLGTHVPKFAELMRTRLDVPPEIVEQAGEIVNQAWSRRTSSSG